jgi:hypothetical protein
MRLDYLVRGDARSPLEGINILREAEVEPPLVRQKFDERVRGSRSVLPRVELFRKGIDCDDPLSKRTDFNRESVQGRGFPRKKLISNTAAGYGKLRRARLAYERNPTIKL